MIVSLDTSSNRLSISLWHESECIAAKNSLSQQRHNETVLPVLDALLQDAGKQPVDLTGVAVGLGPGSFTGVRVGIATALGLSQSLHIPVVGISSYLVIAAAATSPMVMVVGDARQDMLYIAGYARGKDGWETVVREQLATFEQAVGLMPETEIVLSGPDAEALYPRFRERAPLCILAPEGTRLPEATVLAGLAEGSIPSLLQDKLSNGGMPYNEIAPIYLRRTQAEEMRRLAQAKLEA